MAGGLGTAPRSLSGRVPASPRHRGHDCCELGSGDAPGRDNHTGSGGLGYPGPLANPIPNVKLRLPSVAAFAAALTTVVAAQNAPAGRLVEERLRMPPGLGPAGLTEFVHLNGDGLLDMVRMSGSRLTILLQDENGKFVLHQDAIDFSGAGGVSALAAAQLGTANQFALIVGLAGADEVVLTSDGVHPFVPAVPNPIPPLGALRVTPFKIMVGDFGGGTAFDDVVMMAANGQSRVLFNDGAGNLVQQPNTVLPAIARGAQSAAAAGDLDGDGDLDIACSPLGSPSSVVLLNNAGVFTLQATLPGVQSSSIVIGAFVGAAAPDVVMFGDPQVVSAPWVVSDAGTAPTVFQAPWSARVAHPFVGDFNGANGDDLAFLQSSDGSVFIAYDSAAPVQAFAAGDRTRLLAGDLEGDGDTDLVALGAVPPDELWLSNASNGIAGFESTEILSVDSAPIAGDQFGVFLGTQPDFDPNLLVVPAGRGLRNFVSTHAMRFAPQIGPLPALGAIDPTVGEPARITASGADVVLIDATVADGVRMYSRNAVTGNVSDVTSAHWPVTDWFIDVAAGHFGNRAAAMTSDLLFATVSGGLELYRQIGVQYQFMLEVAPAGTYSGITDMIAGHFDGDAFMDVCVLHDSGATVLLGGSDVLSVANVFSGGSFTHAVAGGVDAGVVADLNDDGVLDLMLRTPGALQAITVLDGVGDGTMTDGTSNAIEAVPDGIVDAVVLGEGDYQVLVMGLANGELVKLVRGSGGGFLFSAAEPLPLHGQGAIEDLVVADVDGDGDDDLAVLRAGAVPQILPNRDVQLTVPQYGQMGRAIDFDFYGQSGDVMVMFFDFVPTIRFTFLPFGTLRLGAPQTLIQPTIDSDGHVRFRFHAPSNFLPHGLTMNLQLAWLRGAEIKLGNFHALRFSEF